MATIVDSGPSLKQRALLRSCRRSLVNNAISEHLNAQRMTNESGSQRSFYASLKVTFPRVTGRFRFSLGAGGTAGAWRIHRPSHGLSGELHARLSFADLLRRLAHSRLDSWARRQNGNCGKMAGLSIQNKFQAGRHKKHSLVVVLIMGSIGSCYPHNMKKSAGL